MARGARVLAALLCAAALAGVVGCSSGLTGGSIPPGRSRASGLVVRGDDSSVRVTGSVVRFVPEASSRAADDDEPDTTPDPPDPPGFDDEDAGVELPETKPPGTVQQAVNEFAEFTVEGLPTGPASLLVGPPTDSGLSRLTFDLDFTGGAEYWIMAAPLPRDISFGGMTGIDVTPASISVVVGQSLQLAVQRLGGAPPAVVPSYLLRGSFGTVNERGRFTAVRAGGGSIRIVVGPFEQTIPVTVAAAR